MSPEWTTPEIIVAISSVVIALCALSTAIWQGVIVRKHNKLTVKPILNCHVEISKHCKKVGIYFSNDGIGPAIITSATVERDGKKFNLNDYDFLSLFPEILNSNFHFNLMGIPGVILPSHSQWLCSTSKHLNDASCIEQLIPALSGVSIEVKYESIYGDKFIFLNKIQPPKKAQSSL